MPATRRSVQVLSPAVRLVLGYLARGWQIWFNVCSQSGSVVGELTAFYLRESTSSEILSAHDANQSVFDI